MSKVIANPKTYTGKELESIFFRPMLTGPDALDLGVRVMYNMPVPTTLNYWRRSGDVLKPYQVGFQGGAVADKFQKTIDLKKVKAELGFDPTTYFQMIYENITNRSDVNLQDLTGTDLEKAETALFRESIAESIRATMWLGDTSRAGDLTYNTFDGFLKRLIADLGDGTGETVKSVAWQDMTDPDGAETLFRNLWDAAPTVLKQMKAQGNLVYLVTSDVYANYEDSLEAPVLESAAAAKINGRPGLTWRGTPIIDVTIGDYLPLFPELPQSFAILTDRRNLNLAVNTNAYPGTEVRMWYNEDEIQNRQRAIFMAGCDYLLPELIMFSQLNP